MRSRGRPRSLDRDQALERAMKAFWARGYDGVAVNDLPAIVGASKPTIYAVFNGKDDLYARALAAYETLYLLPELNRLDEETDLAAGLRTWLGSGAARYAGREGPKGCLVVRGLLDQFDAGSAPARVLLEIMRRTQGRLEAFLARFWPKEPDKVRQLAGYLVTLRSGMAVSAAAGASDDFLDGIVALAGHQLLQLNEPK
jgi:AcrR family transcriptional regulator